MLHCSTLKQLTLYYITLPDITLHRIMLHCVVLYHNMSKYIILYSIFHYVFHPVWAACNRYGTVCMDIIVIRRLDFLIDRPAKLDEQAMLYMIHGYTW